MLDDPNLTLTIAILVGLVAQVGAKLLRIPALVLLIALGVVLGPSVANVVRPQLLGEGLQTLVGFAVAVILFEGGLSLDLRRLRRAERPIRRLVFIGIPITLAGATLAAHLFMGFDWRVSLMFGSLVVVTGPTVMTPLLSRLRVKSGLRTTLEAEGVMADAIGVVLATTAFHIAVQPSTETVVVSVMEIATRLGFGIIAGVAVARGLVFVLRLLEGEVGYLQNVLALATVLALYHGANAVVHESGTAAAVAAGIAVRSHDLSLEYELREFKEQLTVMLIGMLFVLLAAEVPLSQVASLGLGGIAVVAALVLVVRPLAVAISLAGVDVTVRGKALFALIAPRGIVAAALASLLATKLDASSLPGGESLRALVFGVIVATVAIAAGLGPIVVRWFDLQREPQTGWLVVGASPIGRLMAELLAGDEDASLLDADPHRVRSAEGDGLEVYYGNPLEERTLLLAGAGRVAGILTIDRNEAQNLLVLQRCKRLARNAELFAVLRDEEAGVTPTMMAELGANVLFGAPRAVQRWNHRLDDGTATVRWLRVHRALEPAASPWPESHSDPWLPLVVLREGENQAEPITAATALETGDRVAVLVHDPCETEVDAALPVEFTPVEPPPALRAA